MIYQDLRAMIDAAVDAGKVQRVPSGVSSFSRKAKAKEGPKFHPELCGKGERVDRRLFLDEIDGDWA